MKKTFLFYFCAVLGLLGSNPKIMAQTDVTSVYLQNADFETNPTGAATDNTIYDLEGWTEQPAAGVLEFYRLGTVAYESTGNSFGDAPSNGSSVTSDNSALLGIKVHWSNGANIYVEQTIPSLPSGKYTLTWDSYVMQNVANQASRSGYVIDGIATYDALPTSVGTWKNHSLEFVIAADKEVTIRLGYNKTANAGGDASPILFVDNVKLISYGIDKTALTAIIAEATGLYDEDKNEAEALNDAIDAAQAVADKADATQAEILTAIDDLKNAIWTYKVANASDSDPLDCTSLIVNPSFEDNFTGWTNNGFVTATNSPEYTKDGSIHIEKWVNQSGNIPGCSISQTISNLANGKYEVKASALSLKQNATDPVEGAFLFANTNQTPVSTPDVNYTVTAIVIDGTLTIGFNAENVAVNWVSVDNFRLAYLGVDLTALEDALTALKTTAESITGVLQTEAATELAAAIAEAETALNTSTESALNAATVRLTNAITAANASIAAYSALLADIEAANAYKTAHSDFDLTDFETAIAAAQAIYDALAADVDAVTAAQAELAAAWKAFRYANTIDLTSKIVDAPVTLASNWTGGGTTTGQQYTGAPDDTYLDYYNKNYDGYQIISNLPNGEYILKAAVRASAVGVGSLYASSGESDEWLHPVIGIGADEENELGNGWYWAEIFDITVSDGTLKIGIKGSATSQRWIGADDFHLYFVGGAQVKSVLQETIAAVNAFLETIDVTEMVGAGLGQYTETAYDDLLAALETANTVNEEEDALQEDINDAETALSNALIAFKASYQTDKNSLPVGDYYIKTAGNDLYWTNMKAVTNEEKPEFKDLYDENIDEQLWTITLDGERYKIVNVHPDEYPAGSGSYYNRFITEKGTFPQSGKIASGYSQAWNTFDFFYNGTAYAVQRTGDASHEFWQLDASNFIVWPSVNLNASTDFILEFVSVATALSEAVAAGQTRLDAAVIGDEEGEYLQSVYDAFEAALAAASTAITNSATAQDLIDFKAAEALFVPNTITAIHSHNDGNQITVFASGKAIEIHSAVPVKAAVYTAGGLLIKETTVYGTQSVPVAVGIYIVKTGVNIVKVVVQ